MAKGRTLGEKSLKILQTIWELGVEVFHDKVEEIPLKYHLSLNHRAFYLKLHDLQKQGYIQKRIKNNQSFFHLTPRGKMQALKYLQLERLKIKKWDGRWRVIIFDIPESLKKWREYLRVTLKNLGFYKLQESVYITPYPVTGELDQYLKEWNLRKYFRYLTVSEIDNEDEFKEVFGLK